MGFNPNGDQTKNYSFSCKEIFRQSFDQSLKLKSFQYDSDRVKGNGTRTRLYNRRLEQIETVTIRVEIIKDFVSCRMRVLSGRLQGWKKSITSCFSTLCVTTNYTRLMNRRIVFLYREQNVLKWDYEIPLFVFNTQNRLPELT